MFGTLLVLLLPCKDFTVKGLSSLWNFGPRNWKEAGFPAPGRYS